MIGEILPGMNILEKLGKLWNWVRGRKNVPAETVVTRFVRLFESHPETYRGATYQSEPEK